MVIQGVRSLKCMTFHPIIPQPHPLKKFKLYDACILKSVFFVSMEDRILLHLSDCQKDLTLSLL